MYLYFYYKLVPILVNKNNLYNSFLNGGASAGSVKSKFSDLRQYVTSTKLENGLHQNTIQLEHFPKSIRLLTNSIQKKKEECRTQFDTQEIIVNIVDNLLTIASLNKDVVDYLTEYALEIINGTLPLDLIPYQREERLPYYKQYLEEITKNMINPRIDGFVDVPENYFTLSKHAEYRKDQRSRKIDEKDVIKQLENDSTPKVLISFIYNKEPNKAIITPAYTLIISPRIRRIITIYPNSIIGYPDYPTISYKKYKTAREAMKNTDNPVLKMQIAIDAHIRPRTTVAGSKKKTKK